MGLQKEIAERRVDELFQIIKSNGGQEYLDYDLSLFEHCLLIANLAATSVYTPDVHSKDDMIVACLLHDIGRFPRVVATIRQLFLKDINTWEHARIGLEYLRHLGFRNAVCTLVNSHMEAKRYLAATDRRYLRKLSDKSRDELIRLQGGPMSEEEVDQFEASSDFRDRIQIRCWNDVATSFDAVDKISKLECYREKVIAAMIG
ncbi:hypothetical protein M422DRAFT_32101 [Sphaerobolus stellatus SS14]|uniref:HD/PDEase domain-containing protein n=1 Tax=Sphaerobolus stellatus (strain SS14) TaxID=990650 RepID=A0A0C9VRP1_SPHS4|nr:hypothetical protein M422DRAFT_32101 [Sphaerobolus stellatus SS14]